MCYPKTLIYVYLYPHIAEPCQVILGYLTTVHNKLKGHMLELSMFPSYSLTFPHILGTLASYILSSASRRFCRKDFKLLTGLTLGRLSNEELYLTHDDGAVDCQLQVLQSGAHHADHSLHAVDLLPQENIHWSNSPHLLQAGPHFVRDVVLWQLLEHLPGLSSDDALSCLPPTRRAILGLDGEDGVQTHLGCVALVTVARMEGGRRRGRERGEREEMRETDYFTHISYCGKRMCNK